MDLVVTEVFMQHTRDRANILNQTLENKALYDYILIDLPPSPYLVGQVVPLLPGKGISFLPQNRG